MTRPLRLALWRRAFALCVRFDLPEPVTAWVDERLYRACLLHARAHIPGGASSEDVARQARNERGGW